MQSALHYWESRQVILARKLADTPLDEWGKDGERRTALFDAHRMVRAMVRELRGQREQAR